MRNPVTKSTPKTIGQNMNKDASYRSKKPDTPIKTQYDSRYNHQPTIPPRTRAPPVPPRPDKQRVMIHSKICELVSDSDSTDDAEGSNSRKELFVKSFPKRRKKKPSNSSVSTSATVTMPHPNSSTEQQNYNEYELDMKILIDSGQCTLHPVLASYDNSNDSLLSTEVNVTPKRAFVQGLASSNHTGRMGNQLVDSSLTVIYIPGVDIVLRYISEGENIQYNPMSNVVKDTNIPDTSSLTSSTISIASDGSISTKKASIYAYVTIKSLPEEMILYPTLLDFVEQAMDTIPVESFPSTAPNLPTSAGKTSAASNFTTSTSSIISSSIGKYTSLPVDVVILLLIKPSAIRLSCVPISKVECLLSLPTVNIVLSSRGSPNDLDMLEMKVDSKLIKASDGSSLTVGNVSSADNSSKITKKDGLALTFEMSNFALNIYHPYGGGHRAGRSQLNTPVDDTKNTETQKPPKPDALTLDVEFVKVTIMRGKHLSSSKSNIGDPSLLPTATSFSSLKSFKDDVSPTFIKMSVVIDIGSASFTYDMRKLSEILAFPKAWYRKAIARKLFLGEHALPEEEIPDPLDSAEIILQNEHTKSLLVNTGDSSSSLSSSSVAVTEILRVSQNLGSTSTPVRGSSKRRQSCWDSLVVFAVNLYKLNVEMKMSSVMGITNFSTTELRVWGRYSSDSLGSRYSNIAIGLGLSSINSQGGLVGGAILLQKMTSWINVQMKPLVPPRHQIGFRMQSAEVRLDSMSSAVFMARFNALNIMGCTELTRNVNPGPSGIGRCSFYLIWNLNWDRFQLIVCESTSTDLVKMYKKVHEFLVEQIKRSQMVFSSIQAGGTVISVTPKVNPPESKSEKSRVVLLHHRHWPDLFSHLKDLKLKLFPECIGPADIALGGSVEASGNELSLICLKSHFRSKSWATFILREMKVMFESDAVEVAVEGRHFTHIEENLNIKLGYNQSERGKEPSQMGSIYWVSVLKDNPPTTARNTSEMFTYLTGGMPRHAPAFEFSEYSDGTAKSGKISKIKHSFVPIFTIPKLGVVAKSTHEQSEVCPTDTETKEPVISSFVSDFHDHLCVASDSGVYVNLSQLVQGYIAAKEKASQGGNRGESSRLVTPATPDPDRHTGTGDLSDFPIYEDWREFSTTTWRLEPTIGLIIWNEFVNPPLLDWILKHLGFKHARTTIPKAIQRGVMDPTDKLLALSVLRMLSYYASTSKQ